MDAYIERALALLAPTPFTEIEVSPEGLWRPAGTAEEFRDIQQDLAAAKPFALEEVRRPGGPHALRRHAGNGHLFRRNRTSDPSARF